jgi:hypothetical protein
MKLRPWPSNNNARPDLENFSLVLGGPLFQLLRWARLSDDALMLLPRRILVISLFAWLPLVVLSGLERHVLGGTAIVYFLLDLEVHARFLVAVPLLIGAELWLHQRILPATRQFLERQIIPESAMPRLNAAVAAAFRLRDSVLAEVLLVALVYAVGVQIVWRHYVALNTSTWYATPAPDGMRLSFAGMWYGYVSLPIFQFLLYRWYYRMAIWARFLWQVSRIELNLIPTHPDRNAGLGFLANTVNAFMLLAAAHGTLVAGQLANRILYLGVSLLDFKAEIAVLVIFLLCVVCGPLVVFAPQLARAKRKGHHEYDILAQRYVRDFDTKWLRGGAPPDEPLLGNADIQSLADLGNGLEVVRTMRVVPVTKEGIFRLVITILVPIAPLTLTIMPWNQLIKLLLGTVF